MAEAKPSFKERIAGAFRAPSLVVTNPALPVDQNHAERRSELALQRIGTERSEEKSLEKIPEFMFKESYEDITQRYIKTKLNPEGKRYARAHEDQWTTEANSRIEIFSRLSEFGYESLTDVEQEQVRLEAIDAMSRSHPEVLDTLRDPATNHINHDYVASLVSNKPFRQGLVNSLNTHIGLFSPETGSQQGARNNQRVQELDIEILDKSQEIAKRTADKANLAVKTTAKEAEKIAAEAAQHAFETVIPIGGTVASGQRLRDLEGDPNVIKFKSQQALLDKMIDKDPRALAANITDVRTDISGLRAIAEVQEYENLLGQKSNLQANLTNAEQEHTHAIQEESENIKKLRDAKIPYDKSMQERIAIRDGFRSAIDNVISNTIQEVYFGDNGELAKVTEAYPKATEQLKDEIKISTKSALDQFMKDRYGAKGRFAGTGGRIVRWGRLRRRQRNKIKGDFNMLLEDGGPGKLVDEFLKLAKTPARPPRGAPAGAVGPQVITDQEYAVLMGHDKYKKALQDELGVKVMVGWIRNGGKIDKKQEEAIMKLPFAKKGFEELKKKSPKDNPNYKSMKDSGAADTSRFKEFRRKHGKKIVIASVMVGAGVAGYALAGSSFGLIGLGKGMYEMIVDAGQAILHGTPDGNSVEQISRSVGEAASSSVNAVSDTASDVYNYSSEAVKTAIDEGQEVVKSV